jgi:cytochrome c peroxidase
MVPAYTDLKLHNITTGLPSCAGNPGLTYPTQCDGDVEPLNQNAAAGSTAFFAGNGFFITRKLWGIANQHSFGHHGQYTTMREAVLAHNGEALGVKQSFQALSASDQDNVIEFLKSLQILPVGKSCLVVNELSQCITPPPGILP